MFLLCLYFPLLETFSEVSLTGLFLWLTADLWAMESVVMICLDFKGNVAVAFFLVKSCSCVFLLIVERKHSHQTASHIDVRFPFLHLDSFFSEVMSTQLLVDWVLEKCLLVREMSSSSLLSTIVAHRVTIALYCCHWSSSDTPTPPKLVLHEQCLSSQSLGRCSLKFCQGPCGYKAVMYRSFTV